jgi:mRNA interferase MazF
MTSTTSYRRGDVVLVPFPFTNQSAAKQRPAIVISSDAYNAAGDDLVIVAVTSAPVSTRPAEFALRHWRAAGLLKPSTTKGVLTTIHKRLVRRRLGRLVADDRREVDIRPRLILGV